MEETKNRKVTKDVENRIFSLIEKEKQTKCVPRRERKTDERRKETETIKNMKRMFTDRQSIHGKERIPRRQIKQWIACRQQR